MGTFSPERSTAHGRCHLDHGVTGRQDTQEGGKEEKGQVEVPGGGDPEEGVRGLVEEADGSGTAVKLSDVLQHSHGRQ